MTLRLFSNSKISSTIIFWLCRQGCSIEVQGHSSYTEKIGHLTIEFWRPSQCQNELHDSSLEILASIISKNSINFQIIFHLPIQKIYLPRLLRPQRQLWKLGRMVNFCMFLTLLEDQICSKWFEIWCVWCNWKYEPKNSNHSYRNFPKK